MLKISGQLKNLGAKMIKKKNSYNVVLRYQQSFVGLFFLPL